MVNENGGIERAKSGIMVKTQGDRESEKKAMEIATAESQKDRWKERQIGQVIKSASIFCHQVSLNAMMNQSCHSRE